MFGITVRPATQPLDHRHDRGTIHVEQTVLKTHCRRARQKSIVLEKKRRRVSNVLCEAPSRKAFTNCVVNHRHHASGPKGRHHGIDDGPSCKTIVFRVFLKVTASRTRLIIEITLAEPIPVTARQRKMPQPPNTRQASREQNLGVRCHFG